MEGLQLLVISKTTNQFFSQNKILIDRIDMIAQVWENKEFENQNHKEKLLKKLLDSYRNEDQKPIPKDSIFLWIFQPF